MLLKIKDAVFNFVWIFPMIRNHREERSLTALFIKLARAKHFKYIKPGPFGLGRLETEYGVVDFWDENAYYAWAKSGMLYIPSGVYYWYDAMASRYAVKLLYDRMRKTGIIKVRIQSFEWYGYSTHIHNLESAVKFDAKHISQLPVVN